jgi:hypothetical protein
LRSTVLAIMVEVSRPSFPAMALGSVLTGRVTLGEAE